MCWPPVMQNDDDDSRVCNLYGCYYYEQLSRYRNDDQGDGPAPSVCSSEFCIVFYFITCRGFILLKWMDGCVMHSWSHVQNCMCVERRCIGILAEVCGLVTSSSLRYCSYCSCTCTWEVITVHHLRGKRVYLCSKIIVVTPFCLSTKSLVAPARRVQWIFCYKEFWYEKILS